MVQVLDKGEVVLLNRMGGDDSVIAAARVSNGANYTTASKGPEADQKLINYLVKHKHGTPFEHNAFQFYVKVPLFVRSEWHRHRIGWSYNEISGRYVEYEPEFYVPKQLRTQGKTNKQGSRIPLFITDIEQNFIPKEWGQYGLDQWNKQLSAQITKAYDAAFNSYKLLLHMGVAKEMSRMILPVGLYTQFYATCNARSLMHFLNLRCAENAQYEIRMYANEMEKIFAEAMPMTYKAWIDNDRVAP